MSSFIGNRAGQQFGNYRLSHLIGRGGFAEVYLGEHIYLKTQVAVKILHTQLAREDRESFLNEARTIAHLKHPNILPVLEFGVKEGTPFLAMDYAPNKSLRERYRKNSLSTPLVVLPHIRQVAAALQYAHEEKIIHRDIKPENMLLGVHDEVLLSDFGIALGTLSSRSQSMEDIAGTVAYMAPELLQGRPHPASDQYALGIVVYEWLSGDCPYHGTFSEIASQHLLASPPPIKSPAVSQEVEAVILRALAKTPEQRFASVQAFADAFERATLEVGSTFRASAGWLPHSVYEQLETKAIIEPPVIPESSSLATTVRSSTSPTAILPASSEKAPSSKPFLSAARPANGVVVRKSRPTKVLTIALVALALLAVLGGLAFYINNALSGSAAATWQNKYTQVTSGKPLLADPLSQNVNGWDTNTTESMGCLFKEGVYHVNAIKPYALATCSTTKVGNLSNIAYQVQMTIMQGNEGGVAFRLTGAQSYQFTLNRNGTYSLMAFSNTRFKMLLHRSSAAIKTGLNQPNLLTVIAQGKQIALYINKQYVDNVIDASATTGSIGLFAGSLPEATDVAFRNVQVWRL